MVARHANVTLCHVIAVWALILEGASQSENRGELKFEEDYIASCLGLSDDEIDKIFQAMVSAKIIEVGHKGGYVTNWNKRQEYKTDNNSTERKRRQRKREALDAVTPCHADVTPMSRPIDTDTDTDTESKKKERVVATRFALAHPPIEWIEFCKTQRPELNAGIVFDGFRDYWIAKAGKDGLKLDWTATWRNWVRNQKTANGAQNANTRKSTADTLREQISIARAQREQAGSG
jgi:hypothetical protein